MKKKLYSKQLVIVLALVIISLQGMEKETDDVFYRFGSDKKTVIVPEYNLKKMRAWEEHYQKNKNYADNGFIIPLFTGVSLDGLELVNKALNQDIDNFGGFYKELSDENKRLLIKVSGQYGQSKEQLMLNIPLLTVQLVQAYFYEDVRKQIEKRCHHILEQAVINHFTLRLIHKPCEENVIKSVFDNIDYHSLWMPYAHAVSQSNHEIPLFIHDTQHEVYASYFSTDTREYRIADKKDNTCSLWIIDHNNVDNQNLTLSVPIIHNAPIKGSCYEKTVIGDEYVVTYSCNDIIISRIKRSNAVFFVEQVHHVMEDGDKIIDVCINADGAHLIIAVYQDYNSRIDIWSLQEDKILNKGHLLPFEDYGLLKKLFISRDRDNSYRLCVDCLFIARARYFIYRSVYLNNDYTALVSLAGCTVAASSGGQFLSDSCYAMYKNGNDFIVFNKESSLMDYDLELIRKNNHIHNGGQRSIFDDIVHAAKVKCGMPVDYQRHYKYSPNGKFLLCCTFIVNWTVNCIKTILMDAKTRQVLVVDKKNHLNTKAVGFTPDGKNIVWLNENCLSVGLYSLSGRQLVNNDTQKIEKIINSCMLSAFLLRDLSLRWKKDKCLHLNSNDRVYAWLEKLISSCEDKDVSNFLMNYFPEVK